MGEGHFTANYFTRDHIWHLDDHKKAEMVLTVSAEEICILWLKQVQPQEDKDASKSVSTAGAERFLWFTSGNVTQWNNGLLDWFYHRQEALILLQEHHLNEQALAPVAQALCRKGWQPHFHAAALTGQGGTHGGTAVLHKEHVSVHQSL